MRYTHSNSSIDNCGLKPLPRHLDPNGSLTEVENTNAFPFKVQRVFYLYDVPADSERGGHSHYQAHELIVAVSGSFKVTLNDGHEKKTFTLDRPYYGLYITPGIWRTLHDFSGGSVCLVMTSEKYSEEDYVRDFSEFLNLTHNKPAVQSKHYPFVDLKTVEAPYLQEIKEAVNRVIESGRYIGGTEVTALETALCRQTGTPYAIGVSNGLDALRLILRGYIEIGKLKPGDEVLVQANTYIASVLAITDNGLKPIFVEPDPHTLNIDSTRIEESITSRTRAIMPVHLYGRACWDSTIVDIAKRHDLIVVEDNAQAIGAQADVPGLYGGNTTGGLGDAAAFSFYPTKNIGAIGDAGAITTYDEQLAQAVSALHNYGSDRRYHNIYAGLNCRLDPIQAAIITTKLRYLDQEIDRRRLIASIYDKEINNAKIIKPLMSEPDLSVWHQYVVRVADRIKFREYLATNGVDTDIHYATPPHRQPCYSQYSNLSLPLTDRLASEVVSLPISSCTSSDDAYKIAEIINGFS